MTKVSWDLDFLVEGKLKHRGEKTQFGISLESPLCANENMGCGRDTCALFTSGGPASGINTIEREEDCWKRHKKPFFLLKEHNRYFLLVTLDNGHHENVIIL